MTYFALCRIQLSNGEAENALPCPFCAAAADLALLRDVKDALYCFVGCMTCKATGPIHLDELGAVTAWNTRYFYQDSDDAPATLPDDNPC